jgi:hypothetical protein
MLRSKTSLPLLHEFTKTKILNVSCRNVSSRHASKIAQPKLIDNQFSRKQFLASRVWDDNAGGKLNERTLPYYLNKMEKLALASSDEKEVALKESSSFLATMIVDKNGVMKNNYYRDILTIFRPVFETDFNSLITNDFSFKRIRDITKMCPDHSLKLVWPFLKKALLNNPNLLFHKNYANLVNIFIENSKNLDTLDVVEKKDYIKQIMPTLLHVVTKHLKKHPEKIIEHDFVSSVVQNLIDVLPFKLTIKSMWVHLCPKFEESFDSLVENPNSAYLLIKLLESSQNVKSDECSEFGLDVQKMVTKSSKSHPHLFLTSKSAGPVIQKYIETTDEDETLKLWKTLSHVIKCNPELLKKGSSGYVITKFIQELSAENVLTEVQPMILNIFSQEESNILITNEVSSIILQAILNKNKQSGIVEKIWPDIQNQIENRDDNKSSRDAIDNILINLIENLPVRNIISDILPVYKPILESGSYLVVGNESECMVLQTLVGKLPANIVENEIWEVMKQQTATFEDSDTSKALAFLLSNVIEKLPLKKVKFSVLPSIKPSLTRIFDPSEQITKTGSIIAVLSNLQNKHKTHIAPALIACINVLDTKTVTNEFLPHFGRFFFYKSDTLSRVEKWLKLSRHMENKTYSRVLFAILEKYLTDDRYDLGELKLPDEIEFLVALFVEHLTELSLKELATDKSGSFCLQQMIRLTPLCSNGVITEKNMFRFHDVLKNYVRNIDRMRERGFKVPIQMDKVSNCYRSIYFMNKMNAK